MPSGLDIVLPKDKPFDVVGLGLNSADHLCVVPAFPSFNSKTRILRYERQGGGQVATALVALSRWGMKTKYIGKVGDDEAGRFSLRSIEEEKVDVSDVTVEKGAYTQYAFILVDARSGERTILWDRDEKLMYRPGELSKEKVCQGRVLHLDGHDVAATTLAARWASEEGIPTVIDIDKVEEGTVEMIRHIDFLITSSEFPSRLTGIDDPERALLALRDFNSGFIASTRGREGVVALMGGEICRFPGFHVKTVDTTGAGDLFHAGFIFGLLQGWDVGEILRFSNAVAALNCTRLGGRAGIPTLETAYRFLQENTIKDSSCNPSP